MQALARGYNVLALDPQDGKVFCWSSSDKGNYVNDQPLVRGSKGGLLQRAPAPRSHG